MYDIVLRADLNTRGANISQYYFGYLREAAATFEDVIKRLNHCDHSPCYVADATDMAHRIKGNAAMYNNPNLGLRAAEVEQVLRSEIDTSDHANIISSLINFVDEIYEICRGSDKPEPSELPVTLVVDNEDPLHVSQSTAAVSINRKRILIAYEDVWISDLMANLLEPEFNVLKAQSAAEVLKLVQQEAIDLLILENVLEGLPTLDLVKILRGNQSYESISVFMAFGSRAHEDIARAISLGVAGFTEDKHEILEIIDFARNSLTTPSQSVLIVDDDPMVRQVLRDTLSSAGLTVNMASDGIEALAYLSEKTPDLILLDRFMPRLEGGTVLYEIQNRINLKSIPVLILTAMVNQGEAKSWFERGAVDFIPKPFDPAEVLMRVKQHLNSNQRII